MKKNVESMNKNLEVVKQYLTQQGKEFRCVNNEVSVSEFEWGDVTIRVSDEQVDVQVHRTVRNHKEIESYLDKLNSILKEGHFEVESGEAINYRIAFPVTELLQLSKVGEMLDTALWMIDYVFGILLAMVLGDLSAKEAFMRTILDMRDEVKIDRYLDQYIDAEICSVIWESVIPKIEQVVMKYIVPEV